MIEFSHYKYWQIKNKVGGIFKSKYKCVCNNICTFDTETTTLYYHGENEIQGYKNKNGWGAFDYTKDNDYYKERPALSFVYEWTFGFENQIYYGRRIEDFKPFILQILNDIREDYRDDSIELYIYVHNLPYDAQFLYNIFDVSKSFQRAPHKQMYFQTPDGLTFKDSYIYSNLSLDSISKSNKKYKKVHGYDYEKIRFPWSPLSDREKHYCEYDCLSLWEYLTAERKKYLNRVTTMPLTNTGKVRGKLQKTVKNDKPSISYHYRNIVPTVSIYKDMIQLFMGGVVHLNALYNGQTLPNIKSRDYTSSYPFVLLSERYPQSSFVRWRGAYDKILNNKNVVWYATIEIYDFCCINGFPYLPNYKSMESQGIKVDNGRVFSGKKFRMLVTNVDYDIIVANYNLQKHQYKLYDMYVAKADYLDDIIRDFILDLYVDKTKYKDDENNIDLYANAKNMFNSTYGMNVCQIVAPVVTFDNDIKDFVIEDFNDDVMREQLNKMRNDRKLVTSFPIGVWCTSYARKNLYLGLNALPPMSAVYSDTDSIKYMDDTGECEKVFDNINKRNYEKLKNALPPELFAKVAPQDIHGESHLIGEFAEEKGYKEFKSFGSKKYAYIQPNKEGKDELHITVAGLNKKKGAEKLNTLDDFKLGQTWNYRESGRTIARYNTSQPTINIDGNIISYKYGVVLQPTTYKLDIKDKLYNEFLLSMSKGYVEYNKTGVFRKE